MPENPSSYTTTVRGTKPEKLRLSELMPGSSFVVLDEQEQKIYDKVDLVFGKTSAIMLTTKKIYGYRQGNQVFLTSQDFEVAGV